MNDSKNKFIGILQLLYENTDAEHTMDTYQIMNALEGMNYGRPDRKTIDANIRYIIEGLGFGVEKEKGKPNRYKWSQRAFENNELKMIADALRSSTFISKKKRRQLIAKLKDFTSIHLAESLDREIITSSYYGFNRRDIQPIVDCIFDAIKNEQKIRFTMFTYDINCNEVPVSEVNVVSPHLILWNAGNFYLIGTPDGMSNVKPYRIGLIETCEALDETAVAPPSGFSADNYSRHYFDMLYGTFTEVILECENSMIRFLIDRFGKDLETQKIDANHFRVKVQTDVNPAFYAWVFAFKGRLKIAGPQRVRDGFQDMLAAQKDY